MRQSRDIITKRHREIIEFMKENNIAYVEQLSKHLKMSEVTIRRDLKELEDKKLIERFHGGARLLQSMSYGGSDYAHKQHLNLENKRKIAIATAQQVQDGDTIFISSSTTALMTMDYVGDKRVRIATNNTRAPAKERNHNTELIIIGGEHSYRRQSLFGEFASYIISKIKASKCILGANGVSAVDGITTTHYLESPINKQMLSQCTGEKIIVADGSKIGKSDGFVYCAIQDIDVLITDEQADPEELAKIASQGVHVIVAK